MELFGLTAFGVFTTVIGASITIYLQTRPGIGRRWRIAITSLALVAGLVAALVWYHPGAGEDGPWVLGFPFPALIAERGKMLSATPSTVLFAFANFVIGVSFAHLIGLAVFAYVKSRGDPR